MGQRLVFVPECQSTNSLMLDLTSKSPLPEGTVVITSNQYAGRGQRGSTWQAAAGMNLTFTVLLRPTFLAVKRQFSLTMMASLAVFDYLDSVGLTNVKIKWPNDILVGGKKICGMLIENSIQGDAINQSIVGIGLNINQLEFPVVTATSLGLLSGQTFDLNDQWNLLIEKLEKRYLQLRAGKQQELKDGYLTHLLNIHRSQKFISNGSEFVGTIKTVSDQGELILEMDGREKAFLLKEISFVI
ncbi:MAG TPA: biotin--[acetyl-CoA-carboxylase] ligase [Cyclobacteriaceae bacterium]|jgi:BirA family biotin operon repressor/biotin-[acetyl-CoA-carboxylase] ligase|nr:biotin--[acetyl-CoA-carboxylase] ligase [Cyclobacteriaceae bacterium]